MKFFLSILTIYSIFVMISSCGNTSTKKENQNSGDSLASITRKDTLLSKQLIIVTSEGWDDIKAKLYCFDRKGKNWQLFFSTDAVLGIKGLGLGVGIKSFNFPDAPVKKEGDLKAPAGIFSLSTAFGYAEKSDVSWLKFPYLEASSDLLCIDDGSSTSYNKVIYAANAAKDWNSCEKMHRNDDLYKWGLVVDHNYPNPEVGKGSCIFVHVWKNNSSGTAGCTAISEEKMIMLLEWINIANKPLLIQFPNKYYQSVAETIDLPVL